MKYKSDHALTTFSLGFLLLWQPSFVTRGCPLELIRAVYERHEKIQSKAASQRLGNLQNEFKSWKPARERSDPDVDDVVEVF